jgi:hypothetical protein
MTTTAFPRVCADLDSSGWPFYPYVSTVPGEDIQWRSVPTLPGDGTGLRWATEKDALGSWPVMVLTAEVITALLHSSSLEPGDRPTRERLAEVVDGRLYAYGCQMVPPFEASDDPRVVACRAWTAELTGATA